MIQNRILAKERGWALSGLENIFHFALEQKSKCLIQASIVIAQQQFCGITTFGHRTQVKFLLESIRHIIRDNCQEEFIHIMQYLKLLHSLCAKVGCEEEYISSILKIKQSYVLYTLLENESAADVCLAMNDFFPKHDPLKSFCIDKDSVKRRFLAAIRRQILSFQKLVTKLLTEVEFRQDYFFDEWSHEFGPTFHEEMLAGIDKYLTKIEEHLLAGVKCDKIYERWIDSENLRNPAMLYFLKLLIEAESGKVLEFDVLSLLKWMFPSLDTMLLTMPCEGSIEAPEFLEETSFNKLLSQTCSAMQDIKPWECESFHQTLVNWAEILKSRNEVSLSPKSFYGSNKKVTAKYSPVVQCTPLKQVPLKKLAKCGRIPLGGLNSNILTVPPSIRIERKRKHAELDGIENHAPKRQCTSKPPCYKHKVTSTAAFQKVNSLVATPKFGMDVKDSTIKISFSSPHCTKLLESGSKFFSSDRRKESTPCIAPDFQTPILGESSLESIRFSDDEDEQNGSDCLNIAEETMANNLTWISTSKNSGTTSHRGKFKKTCRSLHFKSESSDDHVSESEPESEYCQSKLQNCLTTLDQSLIPDLTYHLDNTQTHACTVRLKRLSDIVVKNFIAGCKLGDEDVQKILLHDQRLTFRNYS